MRINENENANVWRAIKNRQEVSLVYCTNWTERLMEKTKKKTIEQFRVREGSPMDGAGSVMGRISGKAKFWVEWKRVGVTDGDSSDDGRDELRW